MSFYWLRIWLRVAQHRTAADLDLLSISLNITASLVQKEDDRYTDEDRQRANASWTGHGRGGITRPRARLEKRNDEDVVSKSKSSCMARGHFTCPSCMVQLETRARLATGDPIRLGAMGGSSECGVRVQGFKYDGTSCLFDACGDPRPWHCVIRCEILNTFSAEETMQLHVQVSDMRRCGTLHDIS